MYFLKSLSLLWVASLCFSSPIKAHEKHEGMSKDRFNVFLEHLEKKRVLDFHGSDEELLREHREIGKTMLMLLEEEELSLLRKQLPPSLFKRASGVVVDILRHWNPISFGAELVSGVREYGLWVGMALASTEVLEKLASALSAAHLSDYPGLAVVPIAMETHLLDLVVFRLAIGIPHVYQLMKTWMEHGGIFKGARAYEQNLMKLGHHLGPDYTQVLGKVTLQLDSEVDVHLIKAASIENKWLRFFSPRKSALEKTSLSISISELKAIAKKSAVDVHFLEKFEKNELLYVNLLVHELQKNNDAVDLLKSLLAQKEADFIPSESLNLELTDKRIESEASYRRFEWLRQKLYSEAKEKKAMNRHLFSKFRELKRAIHHKDFERAQGLVYWIESLLEDAGVSCEAVLLK